MKINFPIFSRDRNKGFIQIYIIRKINMKIMKIMKI